MTSRSAAGLLSCLLAAACSSETVAQPPPPPIDWHSFQARPAVEAGAPTPTEKERATADAYLKALVSPGLAQLATVLNENVHSEIVGIAESHGRERTVQTHDAAFGAFDQRVFTPTRIWLTDTSQVLEWTMTGTLAREWMGASSVGKPVVIHGISLLWTKDDGSITDLHVYFDVALAKASLGVGPKELLALPRPSPTPASTVQVFDQTNSPEEKANVSAARSALDALENRNEAAYVAAFTDDVEVVTQERPQPARGKDEALRAYFRAMHKAIGQLDTTVINTWGVRQYAIVEYFIAGEQTGALDWIPMQRNNVLRLEVVDVMELHDGKIARLWRYDDPAQVVVR
jgi:ketosteroid isomerase-like protein